MRLITLVMFVVSLATAGVSADDIYAEYDTILAAAVQGELVDYALIEKRYARSLDRVLRDFSVIDPEGLEPDDRLAFLINLYNATMIKAVLETDRPGYSPADDGFKVFQEKLVRLNSGTISLDTLENGIIRPDFSDPRIHVALVCGARSCPPLRSKAYRGASLDRELDAKMRAFFADPGRNIIDVKNRELRLSQIFEWFAGDFGGKDKLTDFAGRWVDVPFEGFAISFIPYSWELNSVDNERLTTR